MGSAIFLYRFPYTLILLIDYNPFGAIACLLIPKFPYKHSQSRIFE